MAQDFLDYLRKEGSITQDDVKKFSGLEETGPEKRDLFFKFLYNLHVEQIDQVKAELAKSPDLSFEQAVVSLGLVDADEIDLYDGDPDLPDIKQGQMVIDAGILTLEKVADSLLMFKSDFVLDDYKVDISEDKMADNFINEYLEIMKEGFSRIYNFDAKYGEISDKDVLEDEIFVYQHVIGDSEHHFLAGVAAKVYALVDVADALYKRAKSDKPMPEFGNQKDDAIDLFSEFLNNVNGFCTFKFNVGFDLTLPDCKEHATLQAPTIHVVPLKIESFTINIFVIYGTSYNFEKVV